MCGITGYWNRTGEGAEALAQDLAKAVASPRHRGPDDHGLWTNSTGVGLGHTRLSIIDLSSHGHQPMVSVDGTVILVFNGEVYNCRGLRSELEGKGYRFTGHSDSEVVLAAYQKWGPQSVERFIGMFAIAIWEEKPKRLRLFRDRVGVKPLYYGWDGKVS